MNTRKELRGIIPYLVSPVDAGGGVMRESLAKLCRHLIDEGVHGLCALGSAGEFPYLTENQRQAIVQTVVHAAGGDVPVVAGVTGASLHAVCEEARRFVRIGVDALVALPDVYYPLTDDQFTKYYAALAQAVPDCPIALYTNPKYMHFDISLDVFENLSAYPNILYYKDASGNTGRLLSMMNRFGNRFKIFSASAHVPLFVSMIGGIGWMAAPANLIPRQCIRLYELCAAKQYEKALELQKKLWEINKIFSKNDIAACVKAGLKHLGFNMGDPLPPLNPLAEDQAGNLYQVIDSIRSL